LTCDTFGCWRFFSIEFVLNDGTPKVCRLCGAKSSNDTPLIGGHARDETAGKHPWLYKACHKFASALICRHKYCVVQYDRAHICQGIVSNLIKRVKGDQCGICHNVYRLFGLREDFVADCFCCLLSCYLFVHA